MEVFNPTLDPTQPKIGVNVIFPIFCKFSNQTQLQNQLNYLVSYVFQPSDNLSSVASLFGIQSEAITNLNGDNIQPFDRIFVPVTQLPHLSQPAVSPAVPDDDDDDRKGEAIGLGIGLGITGLLLGLVVGVQVYREGLMEREAASDEEKQKMPLDKMGDKRFRGTEVNLMADVSDCLDK